MAVPRALIVILTIQALSIVLTLGEGRYLVGAIDVALVLGLLARRPWARILALVDSWLVAVSAPVAAYLMVKGAALGLAALAAAPGGSPFASDPDLMLQVTQASHHAAVLLVLLAVMSAITLAALYREDVKEWFVG